MFSPRIRQDEPRWISEGFERAATRAICLARAYGQTYRILLNGNIVRREVHGIPVVELERLREMNDRWNGFHCESGKESIWMKARRFLRL